MAKEKDLVTVRNLKNKQLHVTFPIGARSLHSQTRSVPVEAGGTIEMSKADAEKLIALDRQLDLPEERRTKLDSTCWCFALDGEEIEGAAVFAGLNRVPDESEDNNMPVEDSQAEDGSKDKPSKGRRGAGKNKGA